MSSAALDRDPLCLLVGPTASGKTALSLDVCEALDAEVLSLDSMQVYRGMDLGTAKADAAEQARCHHHLIDLVDPSERFDVQAWLAAAEEALAGLQARGRGGLFVGGTGFYLAALLRGLFQGPPVDPGVRARVEERARVEGPAALHRALAEVDPAAAEKLHVNDVRRVVRALEVLEQTGRTLSDWQQEWEGEPSPRSERALLVGLHVPTPILDERIRLRTRAMLEGGWPDEALRLEQAGGLGKSAVQALGYAEALAVARGELDRETAIDTISLRTRQFARRQRTWYRKFPITWIDYDDPERVAKALAVYRAGLSRST